MVGIQDLSAAMQIPAACLCRYYPDWRTVRSVYFRTATESAVPRFSHRDLWNRQVKLLSLFIAVQLSTVSSRFSIVFCQTSSFHIFLDHFTPNKTRIYLLVYQYSFLLTYSVIYL